MRDPTNFIHMQIYAPLKNTPTTNRDKLDIAMSFI